MLYIYIYYHWRCCASMVILCEGNFPFVLSGVNILFDWFTLFCAEDFLFG